MRSKTYRFAKKACCAQILIEGARFPPFGFDITEINSNSIEDVSFCQKGLLCPDSDRGRSVSPLRVRYNGDYPKAPISNLCVFSAGMGENLIAKLGRFQISIGPSNPVKSNSGADGHYHCFPPKI